jgi:hypothetical protein
MSSKLLEQAIVDAQALRDSAFKSAQATLLEKFAPQVKEAVEKLLEQEEEPGAETPSPSDALAGGDSAAPLTDFGGAPPDESNKGYVSGKAKDVPLAATDGEKLCPCPDDEEDVTLELNLADLADQLKIGREAEEDEVSSQQPMLGGMQNQPPAAGGAAAPIAESLELEGIELEEEILEMDEGEDSVAEELTEVNLDELLAEAEESEAEESEDEESDEEESDEDETEEDEDEESEEESDEDEEEDEKTLDEMGPHGSDYEGTDDPKQLQRQVNKSEKQKNKKNLSPKQKKIANLAGDPNKIDADDLAKLRNNESKTKQLLQASAQLLKEHQNSIKLMEKKDAQIHNLLEENNKLSSTVEEMSEAFKKLDEVNLLNARLFYSNQVLKSASLNERQKTHIAEAISKADSVNEAKAVYETLINSVGGPAEKERSPKSLNEAINKQSSFRLPHKQAEQPADPGKDRWLKLAGIK